MVQENYSGSERNSIGKDEELSKDVVLGSLLLVWKCKAKRLGFQTFLGMGDLKPPRHP